MISFKLVPNVFKSIFYNKKDVKTIPNAVETNFPINKSIIIKTSNLSKKYGKKLVLNNINLEITKGDRVAFVAANGVGKSTLMEILAEIRPKTTGKVYLDPKVKIGIQFQEIRYPHGITVKNMINFYLDIYNIKLTKKELEEKLAFFQLKDLYNNQIVMLSGGQKQRVNLFLALCNDPDVWFLDEITTGLDIKFRTIILQYIDELLTDEKTLLLVSHNTHEIEKLCNRLVVLDKQITICDVRKKKIEEAFGNLDNFIDYFFNSLDRYEPYQKKVKINEYLEGKPFSKTN